MEETEKRTWNNPRMIYPINYSEDRLRDTFVEEDEVEDLLKTGKYFLTPSEAKEAYYNPKPAAVVEEVVKAPAKSGKKRK